MNQNQAALPKRERRVWYELTEGSCTAEEWNEVTVYGIALFNEENCRIVSISDISSRKLMVANLLCLCQKCGVTETTLCEVVEDAMP